MWNEKKACPNPKCDFNRPYDKNNDTFKISEYQYCPKCGVKLNTEPFSTNR